MSGDRPAPLGTASPGPRTMASKQSGHGQVTAPRRALLRTLFVTHKGPFEEQPASD